MDSIKSEEERLSALEEAVAEGRRERHLMREEMVGLRTMVEGMEKTMEGALQAYRAASQRADLLERQRDIEARGSFS